MAQKTFSLGAQTSTGAKTAVELGAGDLWGATLYVTGTFVGTYSVELSPDGGTTWVAGRSLDGTALSGLTAPAMFVLGGAATQARFNITAYTSGTITGVIVAPRGTRAA